MDQSDILDGYRLSKEALGLIPAISGATDKGSDMLSSGLSKALNYTTMPNATPQWGKSVTAPKWQQADAQASSAQAKHDYTKRGMSGQSLPWQSYANEAAHGAVSGQTNAVKKNVSNMFGNFWGKHGKGILGGGIGLIGLLTLLMSMRGGGQRPPQAYQDLRSQIYR